MQVLRQSSKRRDRFYKTFCYMCSCVLVSVLFLSRGVAQQAFPLSVGNSWRYIITYYNQTPPRSVPYTIKIVSDTMMPNGKRFFVLDSVDMFHERFVRSDSTHLYYWDKSGLNGVWAEHTAFNLGAEVGELDTINLAGFLTARLLGATGDTLFGKPTSVWLWGLGGLIFAGVNIAREFGYLEYQYWADYPDVQYVWILSGCSLSDTVYGNMTDVRLRARPPTAPNLLQNYPNPFNNATKIEYVVPTACKVELTVIDLLGRIVQTLVSEYQDPGQRTVIFDGSKFASGIFFYRLKLPETSVVKRMILLK